MFFSGHGLWVSLGILVLFSQQTDAHVPKPTCHFHIVPFSGLYTHIQPPPPQVPQSFIWRLRNANILVDILTAVLLSCPGVLLLFVFLILSEKRNRSVDYHAFKAEGISE